ncbi:hypothetical protein EGW08_021673, partial [Elysia chlorotica]
VDFRSRESSHGRLNATKQETGSRKHRKCSPAVEPQHVLKGFDTTSETMLHDSGDKMESRLRGTEIFTTPDCPSVLSRINQEAYRNQTKDQSNSESLLRISESVAEMPTALLNDDENHATVEVSEHTAGIIEQGSAGDSSNGNASQELPILPEELPGDENGDRNSRQSSQEDLFKDSNKKSGIRDELVHWELNENGLHAQQWPLPGSFRELKQESSDPSTPDSQTGTEEKAKSVYISVQDTRSKLPNRKTTEMQAVSPSEMEDISQTSDVKDSSGYLSNLSDSQIFDVLDTFQYRNNDKYVANQNFSDHASTDREGEKNEKSVDEEEAPTAAFNSFEDVQEPKKSTTSISSSTSFKSNSDDHGVRDSNMSKRETANQRSKSEQSKQSTLSNIESGFSGADLANVTQEGESLKKKKRPKAKSKDNHTFSDNQISPGAEREQEGSSSQSLDKMKEHKGQRSSGHQSNQSPSSSAKMSNENNTNTFPDEGNGGLEQKEPKHKKLQADLEVQDTSSKRSSSKKHRTVLQTVLESTQEIIAFISRSLKPFDLLAKSRPPIQDNDVASEDTDISYSGKRSRSKSNPTINKEIKNSNNPDRSTTAHRRNVEKLPTKAAGTRGWLCSQSSHPGCDPLCDQEYQMLVWPACDFVCPFRCETSPVGSKCSPYQNKRNVGNKSPQKCSKFSRSFASSRAAQTTYKISATHPPPSYHQNIGKQEAASSKIQHSQLNPESTWKFVAEPLPGSANSTKAREQATLSERRCFQEEAEKMIRERKLARVIQQSPSFPLWYKSLDEKDDVCAKTYLSLLSKYVAPHASPPDNNNSTPEHASPGEKTESFEGKSISENYEPPLKTSIQEPPQTASVSTQSRSSVKSNHGNEQDLFYDTHDSHSIEKEPETKLAGPSRESAEDEKRLPSPKRHYFKKETKEMVRNKKRTLFANKSLNRKQIDPHETDGDNASSSPSLSGSMCVLETGPTKGVPEAWTNGAMSSSSQRLQSETQSFSPPSPLRTTRKACVNNSHRPMSCTVVKGESADIYRDDKRVVVDRKESLGVFVEYVSNSRGYKMFENNRNLKTVFIGTPADSNSNIEFGEILSLGSPSREEQQDRSDLVPSTSQSHVPYEIIKGTTVDLCMYKKDESLDNSRESAKHQYGYSIANSKKPACNVGIQYPHDISQNQSNSSERLAEKNFADGQIASETSRSLNHRSAHKMPIYLNLKPSVRSVDGESRSIPSGKSFHRSSSAGENRADRQQRQNRRSQMYDHESINRNAADSSVHTEEGGQKPKRSKQSKNITDAKSQTDKSRLRDGPSKSLSKSLSGSQIKSEKKSKKELQSKDEAGEAGKNTDAKTDKPSRPPKDRGKAAGEKSKAKKENESDNVEFHDALSGLESTQGSDAKPKTKKRKVPSEKDAPDTEDFKDPVSSPLLGSDEAVKIPKKKTPQETAGREKSKGKKSQKASSEKSDQNSENQVQYSDKSAWDAQEEQIAQNIAPAEDTAEEPSYKADQLQFDSEDQRSPNRVIPLRKSSGSSDAKLEQPDTIERQITEPSDANPDIEATPEKPPAQPANSDPNVSEQAVKDSSRAESVDTKDTHKTPTNRHLWKNKDTVNEDNPKHCHPRSKECGQISSRQRYDATSECHMPRCGRLGQTSSETKAQATSDEIKPQRFKDSTPSCRRGCTIQKGTPDNKRKKFDTLRRSQSASREGFSRDRAFRPRSKLVSSESFTKSDHDSQKCFWMSKTPINSDNSPSPLCVKENRVNRRQWMNDGRRDKSEEVCGLQKRPVSLFSERSPSTRNDFSKMCSKDTCSDFKKSGKSPDYALKRSQHGRSVLFDCSKTPPTPKRVHYVGNDRAMREKCQPLFSKKSYDSDSSWLDSKSPRDPSLCSFHPPRAKTREFYQSRQPMYEPPQEHPRRSSRLAEMSPSPRRFQSHSPSSPCPRTDYRDRGESSPLQCFETSAFSPRRQSKIELLGEPGCNKSTCPPKENKRRRRSSIPPCFSSSSSSVKYQRGGGPSSPVPYVAVDQFRYNDGGTVETSEVKNDEGKEQPEQPVSRKISFLGLKDGHYIHPPVKRTPPPDDPMPKRAESDDKSIPPGVIIFQIAARYATFGGIRVAGGVRVLMDAPEKMGYVQIVSPMGQVDLKIAKMKNDPSEYIGKVDSAQVIFCEPYQAHRFRAVLETIKAAFSGGDGALLTPNVPPIPPPSKPYSMCNPCNPSNPGPQVSGGCPPCPLPCPDPCAGASGMPRMTNDGCQQPCMPPFPPPHG